MRSAPSGEPKLAAHKPDRGPLDDLPAAGSSTGPNQSPARLASVGEFLASYGLIDQFRALRIEPGSSLIGRTVAEAKVRTRYGVTLVAIAGRRGTTSGVLPALADTMMRSGDLLARCRPR